jgi:surface polysaccharide O-acyltransferase-like enzyme
MVLERAHAATTVEAPDVPAVTPVARMWGVDLGRALAAVAVVIIHASAAGDAPVSSAAATLRELASFAVPFFLATSAVFGVKSISATRSAWSIARQRLVRLLVPYAAWTVVYIGLKALSAAMADDPERLRSLFRDPGRLVLLGGASVQLYFLPMLAVGMLLLPVADAVARRLRYKTDALGFAALCVLPYWYLGWTGNGYHIATATAFRDLIDPTRTRAADAVVRVLLVAVAWLLRFLPYLGLAVVVRVFRLDRSCPRPLLYGSAAAFVVVELFFRPFQPHILRELVVAFPLLLVCFATRGPSVSTRFSRAVSSVARHSFGIFLVHTAVLQVVQDVGDKVHDGFTDQVSFGMVLACAVPTFLLAWLGAAVIDRIKPLRKVLVAG